MKDGLGRRAVERLARNLHAGQSSFRSEAFVAEAMEGLDALELKARVDRIAHIMLAYLPTRFVEAAECLRGTAQRWESGDRGDPLRGFAAWPMFRYVELAGADDIEVAMPLLATLTPLFSAEFSVRPFIAAHPDRAFRFLLEWAEDSNASVRRLASEGCRSHLPWAPQLPILRSEPQRILEVLERLKDDDSLYVRRSVANNLADIARDHPEVVLDCCRRWQRGASEHRRWIIKRATRNLVKAGHPGVWSLLGYTESPQLRALAFAVSPLELQLGESLQIDLRLRSESEDAQKIELDLGIHFVKASGRTARKVFKWKTIDLAPRELLSLRKRHPLRRATTRVYYPGVHRVDLLINGRPLQSAAFELHCEHGARAY